MRCQGNLPPLYLVTPEPCQGESLDDCLDALERTLESGLRLVQLRAKTLSMERYAALAQMAAARCARHGALLLLNASVDVAATMQADGLHLTSTRLMHCETRPLPRGKLLSVACHDAHQVRQANRIGADLVTLSPVLPTMPHTTAQPLGWSRFGELAALSAAPVYALGGMTAGSLAQAQAAGAHGIAGIRSLWKGRIERS